METKIDDAIFRVIDTEGTARDPAASFIVEVAWVDIDCRGAVYSRHDFLVYPGVPIPPSASAVHHLVDDDVKNAPPWAGVAPHVAERNGQPVECFAAHGADYDQVQTGLGGQWLCTHRLAKHLWPEIGNHSNQEIRYTLLKQGRLRIDLPKDTAPHRAAADAAVTAGILFIALQDVRAKWPEVTTVAQLIRKVAEPCRIIHVPFKSAGGVKFVDAETGLLEWIINKQAGGEDCIHTARLVLAERYPQLYNFNPEDEGE